MDAATAFQAVIDRYRAAYAARDAAGCAALYAKDGEVHSPFGPVAKGMAEIAATHRDWFEDGETNKTMRVVRAGIERNLGYCLVHFSADVPGKGGAEDCGEDMAEDCGEDRAADRGDGGGKDRIRGTSLNVMERGADGIWTITLTSLNELQEQATDQDT